MLRDFIEKFSDELLDFIFNHLLKATTFCAIVMFIGHIFYPQHSGDIDVAIGSYLTAKRG